LSIVLFYWIVLVERSGSPDKRAKFFIAEHPQMFDGLTSAERKRLPRQLLDIQYKLLTQGYFRNLRKISKTGMKWENYEETILEKVGDAGRVRSEKKEGVKLPLHPEEFLDKIVFISEALTEQQLLDRFKEYNPEDVLNCIQLLMHLNIIKCSSEDSKYSLFGMTFEMIQKFRQILCECDFSTTEQINTLKWKAYESIEKWWSHAVQDTVLTKRYGATKYDRLKKIVVALDTSWVPEGDKDYIQSLIQDLERMNKTGKVIFIRGSGNGISLAREIKKVIREEYVPLSNVVIIGSQKTIMNSEFNSLRAMDDKDENKAFVAEIDASELSDIDRENNKANYIRLLELITIVTRRALYLNQIFEHPNFQILPQNFRTIIVKLKAEPFDFEQIKKIYQEQRKALTSA